MFITKSELDTCLFRFVRLMDKLKTKKSLARADYYYINVLEYFTKMPLVENSIPSKFAQSLYKRIRRAPNRVEAFLKFMKEKGFTFEERIIKGNPCIKFS